MSTEEREVFATEQLKEHNYEPEFSLRRAFLLGYDTKQKESIHIPEDEAQVLLFAMARRIEHQTQRMTKSNREQVQPRINIAEKIASKLESQYPNIKRSI